MNLCVGSASRATRSRDGRVPLVIFVSLIPLACGDGNTAPGDFTVRDSLGIEIVENTGILEGSEPLWTVGRHPTVAVGVGYGAPEYELNGVAGAVRLSDGEIVLVNRGSAEVRVYGKSGEFLRSHGGAGEGPGEFLSPVLAGKLGGDSLVVVDLNLLRISLFDAKDGFLSSAQITEGVGLSVYPRGLFADGSVVVGGGYYWESGQPEQVTGGYARPSAHYESVALDGHLVTDFGGFPGAELEVTVRGTGGEASGISVEVIPFSRHPVVDVGTAQFYVGLRDDWQVKVFDRRGQLRRSIRLNREPSPVEERDIEALILEEAGSDREAERVLRRRYSTMEIPKTKPAFASIKVDALGCLWVKRQPSAADTLEVFDVINPSGILQGQVSMQPSARILEIGEDYVLSLHKNELEVESVQLHELNRRSLPDRE